MSDLKKYMKERKKRGKEFADGFEEGYEQFKIGVMLRQAREAAGLNNGEIGKFFGGIQSSSVSQAAQRIGEKVGSDKGLTKIVQKLESQLKV
jgi:hypothetical protein